MSLQRVWKAVLAFGVGVALLGVPPTSVAAQDDTGTVIGTVVDAQTLAPLSGVQVVVEGTQRGTLTDAEGNYVIRGITPGERTVRARMIGRTTGSATVTVVAGETVRADFELGLSVVDMEEIVVTGVLGATPQTKLPFTVNRLSAEEMPVTGASPLSVLQGKIPGLSMVQGSGRPGSAPEILLRGPTSIDASGRGQGPLIIVDGVVMGASLSDIAGLDIESVEVVKGAAAASQFGARAGQGVIQITTSSGAGMADDRTRFTLRSEIGASSLDGDWPLSQNHFYQLNDAGTMFVTTDGTPFDWQEAALGESSPPPIGNRDGPRPVADGTGPWDTYQDKPWPGQTFDHVGTLFDPGLFQEHQLSIQGRAGATNYHISVSRTDEDGVMTGMQGYERNALRLNLDQEIGRDLQLSARSYYSRATEDGFQAQGPGNPLFTLTRMPAGVNLEATDEDGNIVLRPDITGENANPLISLRDQEREDHRIRFLGGANLRWSPLEFLAFDGNVSYDRSNVSRTQFFPVGFRTARTSNANFGSVFRDGWLNEELGLGLTGTVRWSLGDDVNARTQARYVYEHQDFDLFRGSGTHLVVEGIPSLSAASQNLITRSSITGRRGEGFFLMTDFDIRDRYIIDGLVRRDGSSLFGADERWHTYWRVAGAWRVSEEEFFDIDAINELKLRYSVGTAGGRPNFSAQYETYEVLDGVIRPVSLGNRNLRPEHSTEHEAGIDLLALDRVNFTLTYAETKTEHQLLQVPLLAATGFDLQWQNAGTLKSDTWEASLGVDLVQRADLRWNARFLFDRTRQTITELNVPNFQYGVPIQGLEGVFWAREGESLGTFYGFKWATDCSDLHPNAQGACNTHFDVNDDGYLVFVGEGNTWRDGMWGDIGTVGGQSYQWGAAIESIGLGEDGELTEFLPLGSTQPDFQYSVSNTVNWRNLTAYALVDAVRGVDVYNMPRHWSYFENYSSDQDQAGKPENEKKPVGYYGSGRQGLYRQLGPPNSHFVEDGSYVKLRELRLGYRFDRDALANVPLLRQFEDISINVIGRNLITWSDYSGFDPEVGQTGGTTSSAVINRFDGFTYPNFRSFTAAVELGI